MTDLNLARSIIKSTANEIIQILRLNKKKSPIMCYLHTTHKHNPNDEQTLTHTHTLTCKETQTPPGRDRALLGRGSGHTNEW